jgi:hypothetical protein
VSVLVTKLIWGNACGTMVVEGLRVGIGLWDALLLRFVIVWRGLEWKWGVVGNCFPGVVKVGGLCMLIPDRTCCRGCHLIGMWVGEG